MKHYGHEAIGGGYVIAGVPDDRLSHKLVKASELVASADLAASGIEAARFTLGMTAGGPHPHFSIMHVSATPGQLLEFRQRVDEVAGSCTGPIPVEAVALGGSGAFANILYNDENPRLRALRSEVHSLATELGISLAPEQADLLAKLMEERRRRRLSEASRKELSSLEKLGYKDWHATVTNVGTSLSRQQREIVNRIIVPAGVAVGDFSGEVEAVAVYRLGQCGTAVGESLARVDLAGR